jgi:hypothetical protein
MAVIAAQLVANGINHFCHGKGVVAGAETGSSLDDMPLDTIIPGRS